jgi:hypothetical protein
LPTCFSLVDLRVDLPVSLPDTFGEIGFSASAVTIHQLSSPLFQFTELNLTRSSPFVGVATTDSRSIYNSSLSLSCVQWLGTIQPPDVLFAPITDMYAPARLQAVWNATEPVTQAMILGTSLLVHTSCVVLAVTHGCLFPNQL